MINNLALADWPKAHVTDPVVQWSDARVPIKAHTPATHIGIGFGDFNNPDAVEVKETQGDTASGLEL